MRARWNAAAGGAGGVVLVSGTRRRQDAAGRRTAQQAEAQGARVYSGSTSSPESSPYQSIVEALRAALPVLTARPMDPLTLGVLSASFRSLRAQAEPLEVAELSPDRESARLYASLADAVYVSRLRVHCCWCLEDFHWAAGATIDALSAIARRIDRARVLIVATYREEETPATIRCAVWPMRWAPNGVRPSYTWIGSLTMTSHGWSRSSTILRTGRGGGGPALCV